MISEEAKGIQEIAKTSKKALEMIEKAAEFCKKILGDTLTEVSGIAHDWSRFLRYKNLLCIQDRVDEIHKRRKIEGKTIPIPPRYAIPILENASIENEETIQKLWAALIANATDPKKRLKVKKVYIRILSELEPLDALVLHFLSKQGWNMFREINGEGFSLKRLSHELSVSEEDLQISIQNLGQLGCILAENSGFGFKAIKSSPLNIQINTSNTSFIISHLAYSLIEACKDE